MYDYVIVGAGSAGCALAARLSADPATRVLLLEAGGPASKREIAIPAAAGKLFKTAVDWDYSTEPEEELAGRRIYIPRGKVLGGSSSTNMMMYVRGDRADFDAWGPGWRYEDVLPYFRRAEDNARGVDEFHGAGGPLRVEDQRDPNPLSRAFVQAATQAGIPANPDHNGARLDGAGIVQVTQRRGRRWSAADAYLEPSRRRPNLDVVTGAPAEHVVFDGRRATGVAYRAGGARRTAGARREVILAGGAINSPQLLMLSGIGPAEHLRAHGIGVVADVPGVGQGLQDHPITGLWVATHSPVTLFAAETPRQLAAYLLRRRGLLTSNIGEAAAFVRTRPELPAPDLEIVFAPVLFEDEGLAPPSRHGFTLGIVALKPRSRGCVALGSHDPHAAPVIRPRYLSDPADLDVLLAGLRLARRIVAQPALAAWAGEELEPGRAVLDDEGLAASVRAHAHGLYHPVGTCRLGRDPLAVVDAELRVHGVEGLRVADASIMPELVRGHTNAAAIMIGERAADLVRGAAAPAASVPDLVGA